MDAMGAIHDWSRRGRAVGVTRTLMWMAAVLCIAGCNNGSAMVSGTVTLDGQPIAGGPRTNGTVTFYRDNGGGAPAVGFVDEDGHYLVKTGATAGMEPGNYLVAVAIKKITIPADPNAMPIATLLTPQKYTSAQKSGLKAEVKPGSNTFDFELQSNGGS